MSRLYSLVVGLLLFASCHAVCTDLSGCFQRDIGGTIWKLFMDQDTIIFYPETNVTQCSEFVRTSAAVMVVTATQTCPLGTTNECSFQGGTYNCTRVVNESLSLFGTAEPCTERLNILSSTWLVSQNCSTSCTCTTTPSTTTGGATGGAGGGGAGGGGATTGGATTSTSGAGGGGIATTGGAGGGAGGGGAGGGGVTPPVDIIAVIAGCYQNTAGYRLFVDQSGQLAVTDSDGVTCFQFPFTADNTNNVTTVSQSQCFMEKQEYCSQAATYKITFGQNLTLTPIDEMCGERFVSIAGNWTKSTNCPQTCNCQNDCSNVNCLVRVDNPNIQLFFGNNEIFLTAGSNDTNGTCHRFTAQPNNQQILVGDNACLTGDLSVPICQENVALACDVRGQNVTLFLQGDTCPNRLGLLGGLWTVGTNCQQTCQCQQLCPCQQSNSAAFLGPALLSFVTLPLFFLM